MKMEQNMNGMKKRKRGFLRYVSLYHSVNYYTVYMHILLFFILDLVSHYVSMMKLIIIVYIFTFYGKIDHAGSVLAYMSVIKHLPRM